jgi:hypothetical protein
MTIGAIGANASLLLGMLGKSRIEADSFAPHALPRQEKSAATLSILPTSSAQALSFESVLQLQRLDEPEPTIEEPSATEIFLEEAQKHPMERLREQIMKELGISEADLAALPAEERRIMEDRIRQLIEEKLRQGMGVDSAEAGTNAAMLTQFL